MFDFNVWGFMGACIAIGVVIGALLFAGGSWVAHRYDVHISVQRQGEKP